MFLLCFCALCTQQGGYVRIINGKLNALKQMYIMP